MTRLIFGNTGFVNNIAKEKESDISLIVNQLIHSDMQIAKTIG